jgi:hypothetical protein
MSDTTLDAATIDDPSIPVLTERIDLPRSAPEAGRPPEASSASPQTTGESEVPVAGHDVVAAAQAEPQPLAAIEEELAPMPPPDQSVDAGAVSTVAMTRDAAAETTGAMASGGTTDATQDAVTEALRAAVLRRVASALPDQVNATVRELLQPSVDRAIAQLSEEAQVALRIALQDLIEQAVREELARAPRGDAPR